MNSILSFKKGFSILFNFTICILLYSTAKAQPGFTWAKKTGFDCSKITNDPSGNIYLTGSFTGTVDFDPNAGVYNLTSVGSLDAFVLKLNASGNFLWAKQFSSLAGAHVLNRGIELDASGNIYTFGWFTTISTGTPNVVDFDPGPSVYNLTSSRISPFIGNFSGTTYFVSKLNNDGDFIWAKRLTNDGEITYRDLKVDNSGNVFAAGNLSSSSDLDPDPAITNTFSPLGFYDAFILKLNDLGEFAWVKQFNTSIRSLITSITLDNLGNICTTGSFEGTSDFNPGGSVFNLTSSGASGNSFISKLDGGGNFVWAKAFAPTDGVGNSFGRGILTDASGNIYLHGDLGGTVDFNPSALGVFELTSTNGETFISKLNASGNFVWAKQLMVGGYTIKMELDASNNIYAMGTFGTTVDFDPDAASTYNLTSNGSYDIFTLKLNSAGVFVWTVKVGNNTADEVNAFTLDADNNIYSVGNFFGEVDFNPGIGVLNLTAPPNNYISKLNQNTIALSLSNLALKVQCEDNFATLKWATLNEINNKEFTVEKSTDGNIFNTIATVPAILNNNALKQYTFKDAEPLHGTTYYRLIQKDFANILKYTGIAKVICDNKNEDFSIYPNPAIDGNFNLILPKASKVIISNALGQIVSTYQFNSGVYTINLNQPRGIYNIKVISAFTETVKQVIIK